MSTIVTEPACLVVVAKRIGKLLKNIDPQTGQIRDACHKVPSGKNAAPLGKSLATFGLN
jgi:hypothetical protein